MLRKLYFPFVMAVELAIGVAFVLFLIYLIPTLDPRGYLFYGDAPHVPFLQEEIATMPVTVIRWILFLLTACLLLPMMLTIILELARWQINQGRQPVSLPENKPGEETVTRFDTNLKLQHYLLMIGVTLAGALGLFQAFPDSSASRWFVEGVLGLETTRQFHHYFAYIVDFTVFYYIFYLIYKFAVKKEKLTAMLPTFADIKDFWHMDLYILGIKKEEPRYGRYTFGQKIDFFIILIGIPILSLTGLSIHYTSISDNILPPLGIALAAILHRSVALFLAWFVLSVHLYYAHLAPSLFPVNTVVLTGKMGKARYEALFPLDYERLHKKYPEFSPTQNMVDKSR